MKWSNRGNNLAPAFSEVKVIRDFVENNLFLSGKDIISLAERVDLLSQKTGNSDQIEKDQLIIYLANKLPPQKHFRLPLTRTDEEKKTITQKCEVLNKRSSQAPVNKSCIQELPKVLWQYLFTFLCLQERANTASTSHMWRYFVENSIITIEPLMRIGDLEGLFLNSGTTPHSLRELRMKFVSLPNANKNVFSQIRCLETDKEIKNNRLRRGRVYSFIVGSGPIFNMIGLLILVFLFSRVSINSEPLSKLERLGLFISMATIALLVIGASTILFSKEIIRLKRNNQLTAERDDLTKGKVVPSLANRLKTFGLVSSSPPLLKSQNPENQVFQLR